MASLTAEERETHYSWSSADEFAIVVTHERPMITYMDNNPAAEQVGEADAFGGKTYRIPKDLIPRPRRGKRTRTETPEQVSARMAKARESRAAKS